MNDFSDRASLMFSASTAIDYYVWQSQKTTERYGKGIKINLSP